MNRKSWTDDDDMTLRAMLRDGSTLRVIAARLGRTIPSVRGRSTKLRLAPRRYSAEWRRRVGRAWFRAGVPPKRPILKGEHRSRDTEFKPGVIRGNAARRYKAVGAIVIHKYRGMKRRFIKVRDSGPGRRWVLYARHLFESFWGVKLPRDYMILHRDGNQLGDRISNLVAIKARYRFPWLAANRPHMEMRRQARVRKAMPKRAKTMALRRSIESARQQARPMPPVEDAA